MFQEWPGIGHYLWVGIVFTARVQKEGTSAPVLSEGWDGCLGGANHLDHFAFLSI